jgi:outer membrane protein assembly factor BamB
MKMKKIKLRLVVLIIFIFIFISSAQIINGNNVENIKQVCDLKNIIFIGSDRDNSVRLRYYEECVHENDLEFITEELIKPIELKKTNFDSIDSPWPMKCHDLHHTGRSPYSTAHIDGLEKWRFKTDSWIEGGIVIGKDSTIYFGAFDNYLYALNPNGTEKWKYKTGNWIWSTPAIADDGTIYVGSWDDHLHAVNPNGTRKWRFLVHDNIATSPAIGEDGTIYFGTMGTGHRIYAVNPNGTEKWHYTAGDAVVSDPAIGDDGTIYIGSHDNYLYAFNPNGTLYWKFKTGDVVKGPVSIADDGMVYVGSYDGYLYSLYPNNGTMNWKCNIGYGTDSNPSISSDGTIYIGGDKLYAIYPNGSMKWNFNLGEDRWIGLSSSAISSDGSIYVGTFIGETEGGEIIVVNPDGSEKWRKRIAYEWVDSSPSIGEDGTVYIGSSYDISLGYLHAFGPVESNSPPETPTISGEINGKVREEYEYKLNVIDPDKNPISFYIDWGDGLKEWTTERASGENCYYRHTWLIRGNYTIRVKAKDTLGEESDWAYLEVTMPKSRQTSNNLLLKFLVSHPNAFPILRKYLGY